MAKYSAARHALGICWFLRIYGCCYLKICKVILSFLEAILNINIAVKFGNHLFWWRYISYSFSRNVAEDLLNKTNWFFVRNYYFVTLLIFVYFFPIRMSMFDLTILLSKTHTKEKLNCLTKGVQRGSRSPVKHSESKV